MTQTQDDSVLFTADRQGERDMDWMACNKCDHVTVQDLLFCGISNRTAC